MRNMITTVIVTVVITVLTFGLVLKPKYNEYIRLKEYQKYMESIYLRKQGATSTYGDKGLHNKMLNYDLRSWDGGKTWYVVDYNFDSKELKVIGEAEKIYPGLVKHLDAWDKLSERLTEKGEPLDPTDSIDKKVLENAGFTVIKK